MIGSVFLMNKTIAYLLTQNRFIAAWEGSPKCKVVY